MKKIKQLSLILFLSVGLFSCEAEKSEAELKDKSFPGEQIFRCEINGETLVTNDVTVSTTGKLITIKAVFPDAKEQFKKNIVSISFEKLEAGTYISQINTNPPINGIYSYSNASFKSHKNSWEFTTQNAVDYVKTSQYQTGSLNILSINDNAKYFEGKFEYELFAPIKINPNNIFPPLNIRNGYFQYLKY